MNLSCHQVILFRKTHTLCSKFNKIMASDWQEKGNKRLLIFLPHLINNYSSLYLIYRALWRWHLRTFSTFKNFFWFDTWELQTDELFLSYSDHILLTFSIWTMNEEGRWKLFDIHWKISRLICKLTCKSNFKKIFDVSTS
jgi:hypothetical protein